MNTSLGPCFQLLIHSPGWEQGKWVQVSSWVTIKAGKKTYSERVNLLRTVIFLKNVEHQQTQETESRWV